jgi:hypothetical protein
MGIHEPSDALVFQGKVIVKAAKLIELEGGMIRKKKPGWPPAPAQDHIEKRPRSGQDNMDNSNIYPLAV